MNLRTKNMRGGESPSASHEQLKLTEWAVPSCQNSRASPAIRFRCAVECQPNLCVYSYRTLLPQQVTWRQRSLLSWSSAGRQRPNVRHDVRPGLHPCTVWSLDLWPFHLKFIAVWSY